MKKQYHRSQAKLTQDEKDRVFKAAQTLNPEWETIIRLASRCGVPPSVSQHLPWDRISLEGKHLVFTPPLTQHPIRRELPDDVIGHLKSVRNCNPKLCPKLDALASVPFSNQYRKLLRSAGIPSSRALSTLTWDFEDAYPERREQERLLGYLEEFVTKWLPSAVAASLIRQKVLQRRPDLPVPATLVENTTNNGNAISGQSASEISKPSPDDQ